MRGNTEIVALEETATEKQNPKPKTSPGETADFGLVCVYHFLEFQFCGSKLIKQWRTFLILADEYIAINPVRLSMNGMLGIGVNSLVSTSHNTMVWLLNEVVLN